MKRPRHILLASSLLTLLAAACSKYDLVPEATQPTDGADGLVEMTFTATAAPATRTTLGEKGADEYPVLWTSGDEIVVMPAYGRFDKSELEEMKFTTSIEGGTAATATFTGRTQPSENGYIAFYPADKLVEYSGHEYNYFVDFTLPTEQRATAGNFESGIAPAYAKADQEGGDLEFEPMCGLVKFSLAGDVGKIESVRFEAGGQVLSGTYSCNLWLNNTSDITGFESSESHVVLTGPFVAGEDYYMVVAPCSLSGGFSFTFTRDDDSIHVKSGKIEDGYIYSGYMGNFGTIDLSDATFGKPSETDITDMAFIQIVEAAAGITLERNAAGYVPLTEANLEKMASVTKLNISEKGLTDLSALKYFTGLQTLDCSRNSLTELDVSALTNLTSLDCSENALTKLNVSGLTNLTSLDCTFNSLTTLDVSGLTNLTSLDCYRNELAKLDVSNLTLLTELDCAYNQLTALNVSKLTHLTNLDCAHNQLTALDVSNLTGLKDFDCSDNQLTELYLSNLTGLEELDCSENQLTALDVSKLTGLTHLYCYSNLLTALDVSNQTLLKDLDCSENQLTALDVSNQTLLTDLDCADNQLTALDLNGLTALENLDCSENRMSSLDISEFLNLNRVKCGKQTADGVTSRTLTLTLTAAQKAGGVFNASSKYNVDVNLNVVGQ